MAHIAGKRTRRRTGPGRVPPQAVEVEQSVLGACLIDRQALAEVVDLLLADDFYDHKHQRVFQACADLFEEGAPVDLITLTEKLRGRDELEGIGGSYYLTELTQSVDTAANVEYHARIVQEKALTRRLIETTTKLASRAYDGGDVFELLEQADSDLFAVQQRLRVGSGYKIGDKLRGTMEYLQSIHGQPGGITGVPSGFHKLDDLTGGWQKQNLIIIAARPSMGKSALALAMARNAALHPEKPTGVALFTLEMSGEQLNQRLLTSEARIDAQAARTGRLQDDDWLSLAKAAGVLNEAPIYIDDAPGLTLLDLKARCRRLVNKHNVGLVIVDYLQLMTGRADAGNREQEIAQLSRGLKLLAKELDLPVIALAQLSRAVENRGGDKRPQLSDLRESGAIENDADDVLFIYRAERYGITVDENGNSTEGIAEIIIGKQRSGPVGRVRLAFIDKYARFENLHSYYADSMVAGEQLQPQGIQQDAFHSTDGDAPF